LLRCAAVLNNTFREADIVARLGGDEFAVLAAEGADHTCEIILERMENSVKEANIAGMTGLSLSVGVARFDPQAPVSLAELLTTADHNMYEQKRSRRSYQPDKELASASD
jgi:diguanylate cyclase (GGDEF)-like protein